MQEEKIAHVQKNNKKISITINFKEEGTSLQEVIEDLFINYYKQVFIVKKEG